jgi:hypothetical protein
MSSRRSRGKLGLRRRGFIERYYTRPKPNIPGQVQENTARRGENSVFEGKKRND